MATTNGQYDWDPSSAIETIVRIRGLDEGDPKASQMPSEPNVKPNTDRYNNMKPEGTDDPYQSTTANDEINRSPAPDFLNSKPEVPEVTAQRRRPSIRKGLRRLWMGISKRSKKEAEEALAGLPQT